MLKPPNLVIAPLGSHSILVRNMRKKPTVVETAQKISRIVMEELRELPEGEQLRRIESFESGVKKAVALARAKRQERAQSDRSRVSVKK